MKLLYRILLILFVFVSTTSCEDAESDTISVDIIGTWYGTRAYNNPVAGIKYQYLDITFNPDNTGILQYESPVSISSSVFIYRILGNMIICNGVSSGTYGDSDFEMSLLIQKDRLLPQDRYPVFILTRDNSVMTDGSGNEIVDGL